MSARLRKRKRRNSSSSKQLHKQCFRSMGKSLVFWWVQHPLWIHVPISSVRFFLISTNLYILISDTKHFSHLAVCVHLLDKLTCQRRSWLKQNLAYLARFLLVWGMRTKEERRWFLIFISAETNKELCTSCTHGTLFSRYHASLHLWCELLCSVIKTEKCA